MANTKYPTSLAGEQIDQALSDMASRNSEAYAIGKRNGADVSPSDPTYHNNSKYWAAQAQGAIPPGYDATGAVRGDIAQTAQTDAWRKQAQDNIGVSDIVSPLINQWDEQWEGGAYNITTGEKTNDTARMRSQNKIGVKGGTTYYAKWGTYPGNYGNVLFYDANGTFISYAVPDATTHLFTTPSNAKYLAFYLSDRYGTTYNHDVSINYPSSYTGYYPAKLSKVDMPWADLLWENASPTSSFAAQTVSVDLSKYKAVFVCFKAYGSAGYYFCETAPLSVTINAENSDGGKIFNRYFSATNSGVAFQGGKVYASYASVANNDNYAIPYQIYGIK